MPSSDMAPLLERFVKLETSHQINSAETKEQLQKLVSVTETMAAGMTQLVSQQAEVTRLGGQMQRLSTQVGVHTTQIAVLCDQTQSIKSIEKRLDSALVFTRGAQWLTGIVVAAVAAGWVGVVFHF